MDGDGSLRDFINITLPKNNHPNDTRRSMFKVKNRREVGDKQRWKTVVQNYQATKKTQQYKARPPHKQQGQSWRKDYVKFYRKRDLSKQHENSRLLFSRMNNNSVLSLERSKVGEKTEQRVSLLTELRRDRHMESREGQKIFRKGMTVEEYLEKKKNGRAKTQASEKHSKTEEMYAIEKKAHKKVMVKFDKIFQFERCLSWARKHRKDGSYYSERIKEMRSSPRLNNLESLASLHERRVTILSSIRNPTAPN